MKKQQSGFTLIELVIVIVILGLLAATALPRFADLTDEATAAARAGVVGGLRSAMAIAKAQWLVSGSPTTVTLDGGGAITMAADGYPALGTAAYSDDAECDALIANLLDSPADDYEGTSTDAGATCTITEGTIVIGTGGSVT